MHNVCSFKTALINFSSPLLFAGLCLIIYDMTDSQMKMSNKILEPIDLRIRALQMVGWWLPFVYLQFKQAIPQKYLQAIFNNSLAVFHR
jgi:hypothetical protein